MANNEGVVFLGPGKVQVQSIDYPKFQNPSGKPIEHGVILKIVSSISAVPINTWFVAAPPLPQAWCSSRDHLLNNRLQMGCSGATKEFVTLTKQMKIGPCEQVRVNQQTATDLNGSHGLNLSATISYLRDIAVTAPQQTIYI